MEVPDIIYITTFGLNPLHHPWGCWTTRECDGIKYIRADLAGLTWEDIRAICDCFMDAGLHSELPARSKEFYEEVLRRFLENKRK